MKEPLSTGACLGTERGLETLPEQEARGYGGERGPNAREKCQEKWHRNLASAGLLPWEVLTKRLLVQVSAARVWVQDLVPGHQ